MVGDESLDGLDGVLFVADISAVEPAAQLLRRGFEAPVVRSIDECRMAAWAVRGETLPRLSSAAVYFKSGSYYKCVPEEGFDCGKYMGNSFNYMNSVAIVEPADGRVYLVALMSNVLRLNSAVEHQSLATFIEKILLRNP